MKVMGKMGFHEKWIEMIYECINIVSYSILVNGELNGNIKSSVDKSVERTQAQSPLGAKAQSAKYKRA